MTDAVGILGGTFDPVHNGHTRIALDIANKCGLKSIRFVPNAQSPLRDKTLASNDHRLAMLKLAIENEDRFSVDDRELQRKPPSYTIDTLKSLRDDLPDTALCFILGMDAFTRFQQWHRWQAIPELAHLIIAARPGCELTFEEKDLVTLFNERKTDNAESLRNKANGCIYVCDVTLVDVSATRIRKNIAEGKSIEGLVCEPVTRYIEEHGLYQ